MKYLVPAASLLLAAAAAGAEPPDIPAELKRSIVRQYAAVAHAMYDRSVRLALTMRTRIGEFLANPSPEALQAARDAWIDARRIYGQSEVLRFYDGPIDAPVNGLETLINAWPVDEAYIDSVRGNPGAGIINSPAQFPNLNATMLAVWNQRGGEANVSTGWHAIEFLLWGQDFNASGPGTRPHGDFVIDSAPNAARRAEYLRLATDLLLDHLRSVREAWAPDTGAYRVALESGDPNEGLRRILTGMTVLSGFEMGGERMAVPYETKSPEDEHSCFSDTTHNDLVANELGIAAVYQGCWEDLRGPGLRDLAGAVDQELSTQLDRRIAAALAALRAIPPPFDQAIRAGDDAPARRALLGAIEALEDQTAALAALGAKLGFDIAIAPGKLSDMRRQLTTVALAAMIAGRAPAAAAEDAALGGPATVQDAGSDAFGFPARVLDRLERRAFAVGNAFFKENWVTAPSSTEGLDGLGPLFNARSCSSCHFKDGRGRPPGAPGPEPTGFLLRIGVVDAAGGVQPHPAYGSQLQDLSIPGVDPEVRIVVRTIRVEGRYGDGTAYALERPEYQLEDPAYGPLGEGVVLSPRVAPQLIGMGLLEAIAEETILARSDPDDRDGDGISGRPNYVWSERAAKSLLGRFGWKANQPTIEQQVANAFQQDLGITSVLLPQEPLTPAQQAAFAYTSGGQPEIDDHKLARLTFYCQALAVPAQRNLSSDDVRRGAQVFVTIGCDRCHAPALVTGDYKAITAFRAVPIRPYTDLLLHDMGTGLADGKPDGLATGSEWRTPPLWGIGLFATVNGHTRYLHDGRARDLAEAILWHGGEAARAKAAFEALPAADRAALIAFLQSL